MNAAVVGFGGMGCRHAYSLFFGNLFTEIWIVEPNENVFNENCERIGINKSSFRYINSIDDLSVNIDFVIIATTSLYRYEIFENLVLKKSIKYFLLEKVVFQNREQFQKALEFVNIHGVKAYCNFVNRYYPNYINIKKKISIDSNLKMIVSGGDFGLGCNSLHYLDLFQYLTNSIPNLSISNLSENIKEHKRGQIFKEVYGQMLWVNQKRDVFLINSDSSKGAEVEITIYINDDIHVLNEKTLIHLYTDGLKSLQRYDFNMLFSSHLTNEICKDILSHNCLLPTVEDSMIIHTQLFDAINTVLGIPVGNSTPIT